MKKLYAALISSLLVVIILSGLTYIFYIQNIDLRTEKLRLEALIHAGDLYLVDFSWEHEEISASYHAVNITAIIFNSGTSTANPLESLYIEIYDVVEDLQETENLHIGSISGESSKKISYEIQYIGNPPSTVTAIIS